MSAQGGESAPRARAPGLARPWEVARLQRRWALCGSGVRGVPGCAPVRGLRGRRCARWAGGRAAGRGPGRRGAAGAGQRRGGRPPGLGLGRGGRGAGGALGVWSLAALAPPAAVGALGARVNDNAPGTEVLKVCAACPSMSVFMEGSWGARGVLGHCRYGPVYNARRDAQGVRSAQVCMGCSCAWGQWPSRAALCQLGIAPLRSPPAWFWFFLDLNSSESLCQALDRQLWAP